MAAIRVMVASNIFGIPAAYLPHHHRRLANEGKADILGTSL